MDERINRLTLSNNLDNFRELRVFPNNYDETLKIPKTIQMNIEYLSFIAHPESETARKRLEEAFQLAVLKERNYKSDLIKKCMSNREWPRIESSIRKGNEKLSRAFVLWHAYKDFESYKEYTEKVEYTFSQFIVRSFQFYKKREEDFIAEQKLLNGSKVNSFFGRVNESYYDLHSANYNKLPKAAVDCRQAVRHHERSFEKVKKVLHLIQGLYMASQKAGYSRIPHSYILIYDVNWVRSAVSDSQNCLVDLVNKAASPKRRSRNDLKIDVGNMDFFDLEDDPIFLRKLK